MTGLEMFEQAAEAFEHVLNSAKNSQWRDATPCTEWDVRAVANHMTYELLWVPELVEGKTIGQIGDKYEGDVLGDDPKAAFIAAAAAATRAFAEPGALQKTVHLSFGDTTADDYMKQLIADLAVHAWDLAKGLGQDHSISPELITCARETLAPMAEDSREAGYFAEEVAVPEDASEQDKLLALTGRNAAW